MMTIAEYKPTEILQPFIKAIIIIESGDEQLQNRVLPNTSVALAFCFNGQNSYTENSSLNILPKTTVSGLRKSVRLINYSKKTSTLIVLFKENSAAVFFKEPLYELFEKSISLDNIEHPNEIRMIEEMLCEAKTDIRRIKIVEQFLIKKLNYTREDNIVSAAITKIRQSRGLIRIQDLALDLHMSNDAFEKRFRKVIGSSPKQFASITRMSSIIHRKSNERFLDIAFEAGYYDQAHFNKDFKLFTGQTPTEFYRDASFW
ncbi:helix-turn-helix transcriptional regulator [Chryseobacterium daecheongense]|uniref:response regulator transcription factor n=1 Tax=Chryseobacterium daecheongense TaxID=192389 RepID=UPI001FD72333|nr:response regulator transcription factor [Chryseobacterium daecheongense]UOU97684.1 helix-turn-helix transcriptional regulator [Chryseobacterium daecheongense]